MLPYFARHINNWFKKDTLEYHYQKHLILLFSIHCMRVFCRHDDGFAFVEFVFYAVDGDFTGSVEAGDEGIAAGLVGADLLVLVEGKQRHTDGVVLGQRLADHLPRLIGHLY